VSAELEPIDQRQQLAPVEHWAQPVPTNLPKAAAALVEWAQAASAAHQLAQSLTKTNFVPGIYRGKPDEATAAILAGAEVGLSPMASLQGFDMISGQAYPKALTLRAVLQAQGHEFVIDQSTPTVAKGRGRRRGLTEWQHAEWTIQRARQLGLIGKTVPAKDNWIKQPTAMLVARLTSELARLVAADAILGIAYSAEEIRDGEGSQVAAVTSPRRSVMANVGSVVAPSTGVEAPQQPPGQPDAPPPDEPPQAPGADSPPFDQPPEPLRMISQAQQRLLHKLLNDQGMDRDSGLTYASETIERPIESTKELTLDEARQVIDALQQRPARGTVDVPLPDEPPMDDR
jgi:hypothetical protein